MSRTAKALSLITVLALVISLVAVIPVSFAGADEGTGGDIAEFISTQDLIGVGGSGVVTEIGFVSTQFGDGFSGPNGAHNIASIMATVPDDNEVIAVDGEASFIEDVGPGALVVPGVITAEMPIADLSGNGTVGSEDFTIRTTPGLVNLVDIRTIVPATGTISFDSLPSGVVIGDAVEIDYATSEIDSTSVEVTSDSEPNSASGLGLEFSFDEPITVDTARSPDSLDFLTFFLLLSEDDLNALDDVIDDDPLDTGVDDIDELIDDVADLQLLQDADGTCDLDDEPDCIDLSGFNGTRTENHDDWTTAANWVVEWQEMVATNDPDVVDECCGGPAGFDDVVSGDDDPDELFNLTLEVAADDDVTVKVGNTARDTVIADLTAPEVEAISPADGIFTKDDEPLFEVRVTDAGALDETGAGITEDDYHLDLASSSGALTALDTVTVGDSRTNRLFISGIDDGHRLRFTVLDLPDDAYTWGIRVVDDVGNVTDTSDDFTFDVDTVEPITLTAVTGLGVSDGAEVSDPEGISVRFDAPVDASSLDEDDFDVAGSSPPDRAAHFETLWRTESTDVLVVVKDFEVHPNFDILDSDGDDDVDEDDIMVLVETTEFASGTGAVDTFTLLNDVADGNGDGRINADDVTVVVDNFPFEVTEVADKVVTLADPPPFGFGNVEITHTFEPDILDVDEDGDEVLFDADPAAGGEDDENDDGDDLDEGEVTEGDTILLTFLFDSSDFVYLTVEGLGAGSEPTINLTDEADGVDDLAGNTREPDSDDDDDVEEVDADDRIDPTVNVITGSLLGDEQVLTIIIESNEDLNSKPDVTIIDADGGEKEIDSADIERTSDTRYELTVTAGEVDFGLDEDGFMLLRIEAEDDNGNDITVEVIGFDGLEIDLLFNGGEDPGIDPFEDDGVRTATQGIDNITRVDLTFLDEDGEYTGDGRDGVMLMGSTLAWNTLELVERNASGQSGTATLTRVGDKTDVSIDATPGISGIQHIHSGSCDVLGPIVFPLDDIGADGESTTRVDVNIDDLRTGDFAINLHLTTDPSVYTSCADIPVPDDIAHLAFSNDDANEWGWGMTLDEGSYTQWVSFEDEAGNVWSEFIDYLAEAPVIFGLDIQPGWQMIGIPTRLDSASLDKVFGPNRPDLPRVEPNVTKVRTWSQALGWQVSNYDPVAGEWVGDILALRPGIGYYAFSETAEDIEVTLRRILGLPPVPQPLSVTEGWMYISPVLFGLPLAPPGVDPGVIIDFYLENTAWDVAYGFHPDPDIGFVRIAPTPEGLDPDGDHFVDGGQFIPAGQGVLVHFQEDGVINP